MNNKNLIVLCDGTWQDLNQPFPTNVVRLLEAIAPQTLEGNDQIIYYDEGIGTQQVSIEPGPIDKLIKIAGGALGLGIDHRILKCYRFLCLNYRPGDKIYLFGFSRGAYTVRSLAGLIYNCGLLRSEHVRMIPQAYSIYRRPNSDKESAPSGSESVAFRKKYAITDMPDGRPRIQFMGLWDTVKALGIPDIPLLRQLSKNANEKYEFHDHKLSPIIDAAFHAVSIEEKRSTFSLIPIDHMSTTSCGFLQQAWFPGGHGGVGGGEAAAAPLADCALQWMFNKLDESNSGLHFDADRIEISFSPNPQHNIGKEKTTIIGFITNFLGKQRRAIPIHTDFMPKSIESEVISVTTLQRLQGVKGWLPPNLHDFYLRKKLGDRWDRLLSELYEVGESFKR
jgi:uncharacterized protein (DUF2235 family)